MSDMSPAPQLPDGGGKLPSYVVRRNPRARGVRLRVSAREGLVVTLPPGVPEREAARAVASRLEWVTRHLDATRARRDELAAPPEALLPSRIELRAFSESWPVEYRETASDGAASARASGASILVSGKVSDPGACLAALRRWRGREARRRLAVLLAEVSARTGIPYARLTVRGQRSRWGSCSGAGTISLNRDLIFLPEHLVRYVVLHELSHRLVMGHGPEFWAALERLLERHGGGCSALQAREQMRDAHRLVPAWAVE